ncbi:cellulose synthase [Nocardioides anomalus]|uniref:Cellulose synthase n=1 Tax=Nocardioides anomalus TaxID=2712223 RepID=A0A6G6WE10_9ACTN|nr:cellulose synthase [Nocardioides anomalus]QIG43449.1 cellulose synthase [Nocardioides anomalus]
MDDVSWGALAAALTLVAGIYTWFAFRRRGLAAGLRGAGLTLLPPALWLTDTLELVGDIGSSVAHWVGDFAFSPAAWLGIVLAGLAVVCWVVSGFLTDRGVGGAPARAADQRRELPKARGQKAAPAVDPEMAEIEALLRKRGIS